MAGRQASAVALLCLLLGCPRPDSPADGPPASPSPQSTASSEPPVAATETPLPAHGRAPILDFQPVGLSDLYVRFFTDDAATRGLALRLGQVLDASSVAFEAAWNEEEKSGAITLYVPEADRRGESLADAIAAGAPVPAQILQPMLAPLAEYREDLASRFDLRILAFDIRLAFWDAGAGGYCSVGGETGDPEGRLIGRCFRCLDPREGGRVEACRQGDSWPGPLEGSGRTLHQLERALRSNPF